MKTKLFISSLLVKWEYSADIAFVGDPPPDTEVYLFDSDEDALNFVPTLQGRMDKDRKITYLQFISSRPNEGIIDMRKGGLGVEQFPYSRDEDLATMKTMIKYGGGFVRSLGEAAIHADSDNLRSIKQCWPEYWGKYQKMSEDPKIAESIE